jgi:hypothetical protein
MAVWHWLVAAMAAWQRPAAAMAVALLPQAVARVAKYSPVASDHDARADVAAVAHRWTAAVELDHDARDDVAFAGRRPRALAVEQPRVEASAPQAETPERLPGEVPRREVPVPQAEESGTPREELVLRAAARRQATAAGKQAIAAKVVERVAQPARVAKRAQRLGPRAADCCQAGRARPCRGAAAQRRPRPLEWRWRSAAR